MSELRQQASIERNVKRRFERQLRKDITKEWLSQTRRFVRSYGNLRMIPNLYPEQERIDLMLVEHYIRVANKFGFRMRRYMPERIAMRDSEAAMFNDLIMEVFTVRAAKQAELITRTTLKEMDRVVLVIHKRHDGEPTLDSHNLAPEMGQELIRRSIPRAEATACYETQWAAETAKHFETMVLVGQLPEVKGAKSLPVKMWDSLGDSRVRSWHLEADGVQVPINMPFSVKGQALQFPGDTSLGATPDNVINCRCSSVTSVTSVITARQDLDTFVHADDLFLSSGGGVANPSMPAGAGIEIQISPHASTEYKAFINQTILSQPDEILDILRANGVRIRAGSHIDDMNPMLKGKPGVKTTWNDMLTVYDPSSKTIYISQDLAVTIEHQAFINRAVGQAIDDILNISGSAEFKLAWEKSMAILASKPSRLPRVKRFLTGGREGMKDALYEGFAVINETGSLAKTATITNRKVFKPINELLAKRFKTGKLAPPNRKLPTEVVLGGKKTPKITTTDIVKKPKVPKAAEPAKVTKPKKLKRTKANDEDLKRKNWEPSANIAFSDDSAALVDQMLVNTGGMDQAQIVALRQHIIETVPTSVLNLLNQHNIQIRLGKSMRVTYGKGLPAKTFDGRLWSQVSGCFSPRKRTINVVSKSRRGVGNWRNVSLDEMKSVMNHEIGHAVDDALSHLAGGKYGAWSHKVSGTGKFIDAWRVDVARMDRFFPGMRKKLWYFTENSNEAFAEAFLHTTKGGITSEYAKNYFTKEFAEQFPEVNKAMKAVVADIEKKHVAKKIIRKTDERPPPTRPVIENVHDDKAINNALDVAKLRIKHFKVAKAVEDSYAIRKYRGPGYKYINNYLRGSVNPDIATKKLIRELDIVIDKNRLTHDINLYRGANLRKAGKLEVGTVIEDKAFSSFSANFDVARNFYDDALMQHPGDSKGIYVIRMKGKAGDRATTLTDLKNRGEYEILYGRGQKYRVISIDDVDVAKYYPSFEKIKVATVELIDDTAQLISPTAKALKPISKRAAARAAERLRQQPSPAGPKPGNSIIAEAKAKRKVVLSKLSADGKVTVSKALRVEKTGKNKYRVYDKSLGTDHIDLTMSQLRGHLKRHFIGKPQTLKVAKKASKKKVVKKKLVQKESSGGSPQLKIEASKFAAKYIAKVRKAKAGSKTTINLGGGEELRIYKTSATKFYAKGKERTIDKLEALISRSYIKQMKKPKVVKKPPVERIVVGTNQNSESTLLLENLNKAKSVREAEKQLKGVKQIKKNAAVEEYRTESDELNGFLRKKRKANSGNANERDVISGLDEAFNQHKKFGKSGVTLYRGLLGKNPKLNIGSEVTDLGYSSFSSSADKAMEFTHSGGTLFRLKTKAGDRAISLGNVRGMAEYEVLYDRGSRFVVTAIDQIDVGIHGARRVVTLEPVGTIKKVEVSLEKLGVETVGFSKRSKAIMKKNKMKGRAKSQERSWYQDSDHPG